MASQRLWFDVERRYKTIVTIDFKKDDGLWFDVERRYKTIAAPDCRRLQQLWFDVERRYKTIRTRGRTSWPCCGLMQKDDIRQFGRSANVRPAGCGLMQKDEIRQ